MKKLLVFILLCATALTSCSAGGGESSHTGEGEKKLPECAPYGTENVSYTAEISDGRRAVTLGVKRTDGISVVTVTTPEELARTVITDDVEGMRMMLKGEVELPLSHEASAGLSALLALYLPLPEDAVPFGEREAEFTTNGYQARLRLTEDGYPDSAVLSIHGVERQVKFTRND